MAQETRRRVQGRDATWRRSCRKILGAENELRDALTNLLLNAVDALPEGGTITLRTRARRARQTR